MFDVDAPIHTVKFQEGTTRVLVLARAQGSRACAVLGELHAQHAQLQARRTDPDAAVELLALEAAMGRAVNHLAACNADIARLRRAAI